MLKKIISIIVALTVFFSTAPAFAQEVISPLKEGQRAPFAGVLFNVPAAAKIKTDIETAAETCKIEKDRELDLASARSDLDIANLSASVEAVQKRLDATLELKNDQIGFLNVLIKMQM